MNRNKNLVISGYYPDDIEDYIKNSLAFKVNQASILSQNIINERKKTPIKSVQLLVKIIEISKKKDFP